MVKNALCRLMKCARSVLHMLQRYYAAHECHRSSSCSPRFSWHLVTGRVLGPHAVFSSRLVIASILVTQVLG